MPLIKLKVRNNNNINYKQLLVQFTVTMLDGSRDKEIRAGLCYVMVTRITTIQNRYIPKGLLLERITDKIQNAKGLQSRINEEARLHELTVTTLRFLNSFVNNVTLKVFFYNSQIKRFGPKGKLG